MRRVLPRVTQPWMVPRQVAWRVVPRRMAIKLTAGDVKLDFTEAVITSGSLHIEVDLGLGVVRLQRGALEIERLLLLVERLVAEEGSSPEQDEREDAEEEFFGISRGSHGFPRFASA